MEISPKIGTFIWKETIVISVIFQKPKRAIIICAFKNGAGQVVFIDTNGFGKIPQIFVLAANSQSKYSSEKCFHIYLVCKITVVQKKFIELGILLCGRYIKGNILQPNIFFEIIITGIEAYAPIIPLVYVIVEIVAQVIAHN